MITDGLRNEEKQLCAIMRSVITEEVCPDYLENEESHKVFYRLCTEQKVQAMAYMCIKNSPSFLALSEEGKAAWHKNFLSAAAIQRQKDMLLFDALHNIPNDGSWYTVKGISLREIYPVPEFRPSGDEDIRVCNENFDSFISRLLALGFEITFEDKHQYVLKKDILTLEVERVCGDMPHTVLNSSGLPTLSYSEHLAFLFNHAAEHFCHGGFGIRILADIYIFATHYENDIDWDKVFELLETKRIFALNIFALCGEIFGKLPLPISDALNGFKADTLPLLCDILASGIYGTADEARKLSGRLTSQSSQNGILRTAFPHLSHMRKSYPVLNKFVFVLPFLYVHRLVSYSLRAMFTKDKKSKSSGASLGMERLVLLKKYGLSGKHQN